MLGWDKPCLQLHRDAQRALTQAGSIQIARAAPPFSQISVRRRQSCWQQCAEWLLAPWMAGHSLFVPLWKCRDDSSWTYRKVVTVNTGKFISALRVILVIQHFSSAQNPCVPLDSWSEHCLYTYMIYVSVETVCSYESIQALVFLFCKILCLKRISYAIFSKFCQWLQLYE